jgi:hypothetical protein
VVPSKSPHECLNWDYCSHEVAALDLRKNPHRVEAAIGRVHARRLDRSQQLAVLAARSGRMPGSASAGV